GPRAARLHRRPGGHARRRNDATAYSLRGGGTSPRGTPVLDDQATPLRPLRGARRRRAKFGRSQPCPRGIRRGNVQYHDSATADAPARPGAVRPDLFDGTLRLPATAGRAALDLIAVRIASSPRAAADCQL